jgi:hypothetical protein
VFVFGAIHLSVHPSFLDHSAIPNSIIRPSRMLLSLLDLFVRAAPRVLA